MGRRSKVAKASLAAAFVTAGGAAATGAQAAANPGAASVDGIISSYFGPLGLRDDFQHYLKESSGFENFSKFWKLSPGDATRSLFKFTNGLEIPPPPGFDQGEIG